jgi:coenzyme PQQ synthesis protein D (PqqD)
MTPPFTTAVHAISAEVGDLVVVVDLRDNSSFELNATGSRIWRCLERDLQPADIAKDLVSHFGIDEKRAAVDVSALIDQLREHGLLNS